MTLCYVTDRKALAGSAREQLRLLLENMERAARAGVDWIQIREKDLAAQELSAFVEDALRRIPRSCRILLNDRLDVACAAAAGGVHLGEQSMPVEEAKRFVRERHAQGGFLVGASAHSLGAARAAEKSGADYLIFGPVFPTPSKKAFGEPQGIRTLAELCRVLSIPVLAIGGITVDNAAECAAAGAAGIAAIRLFQEASDLDLVVRRLGESAQGGDPDAAQRC
jgi:thiamine-phosphate pyrophosphorylase